MLWTKTSDARGPGTTKRIIAELRSVETPVQVVASESVEKTSDYGAIVDCFLEYPQIETVEQYLAVMTEIVGVDQGLADLGNLVMPVHLQKAGIAFMLDRLCQEKIPFYLTDATGKEHRELEKLLRWANIALVDARMDGFDPSIYNSLIVPGTTEISGQNSRHKIKNE